MMTESLGAIGVPVEPNGLTASTSLSDRELLAAMVSSNGHGHKLADRLLTRFGSVAAIAKAHPADLTIVNGIGQATAARLTAAFQLARQAITEQPPTKLTNDGDIASVVTPLLCGRSRERVVVVICNRARRVIGCEIICEGSASRALLPLRETVVAVLRRDGQAFAVAHNHPSGDPTPSKDDIESTLRMQQTATATELKFLGHVVVTDTAWRMVPNHLGMHSLRIERPAAC